MHLPLIRAALFCGCLAAVQLASIRNARAESNTKVEGFDLLGSVGYGFATEKVELRRESDQTYDYGVLLGADFGYTWRSGLRLGGVASFGFTDGRSSTTGASVGYDLLIESFRLRGSFEGGLLLWWGGGSALPNAYVGPGVTLLWQHGALELGAATKYLVAAPDRFELSLMAGARF